MSVEEKNSVKNYLTSLEHLETMKAGPDGVQESNDHRISCHRCGNIRKQRVLCCKKTCPHIFCKNCWIKMKEEYGHDAFDDGCPVCKDKCCCSDKSISCRRINHCYRKCPASKNKAACCAYKEELGRSSSQEYSPRPFPAPSKSEGILDMLASVADSRLNDQIDLANNKRKIDEVSSPSVQTYEDKSSSPINPAPALPAAPLTVGDTSSQLAPAPYMMPFRYPFSYAPPSLPSAGASSTGSGMGFYPTPVTPSATGSYDPTPSYHQGFIPYGYFLAPMSYSMSGALPPTTAGGLSGPSPSSLGGILPPVGMGASGSASTSAGAVAPGLVPPNSFPLFAPVFFNPAGGNLYFGGTPSGVTPLILQQQNPAMSTAAPTAAVAPADLSISIPVPIVSDDAKDALLMPRDVPAPLASVSSDSSA